MDIDIAFKDQVDAEYREAERLVPLSKNRRLWGQIRDLAARAFDQGDHTDIAALGGVPVLRYNGYAVAGHRRERDFPVSTDVPLERCAGCYAAMAILTPFWVNGGSVILQVELCASCAVDAIDVLEAQPQISFDNLVTSK